MLIVRLSPSTSTPIDSSDVTPPPLTVVMWLHPPIDSSDVTPPPIDSSDVKWRKQHDWRRCSFAAGHDPS